VIIRAQKFVALPLDFRSSNPIDAFPAVCSNDRVLRKGKILAIDYGDKNIGLACSDALGLTVQPLPSFPNRGRKDFLQRLKTTVHTMDIKEIVLGIPVNMDGTLGDSAVRMDRIKKALKAALCMPLTGVDERLSTVEALEFWRDMGPKQQKKYRTVDSLAAALILERYLEEN
jgi:putative holliday junction resolvase